MNYALNLQHLKAYDVHVCSNKICVSTGPIWITYSPMHFLPSFDHFYLYIIVERSNYQGEWSPA